MKKILLTGFALVSLASQAQTWTAQASKLPTSFIPREISAVDANVVWTTVGDGTAAATSPKTYLKTVNGGTTWTPGPITGPPSTTVVGDIMGIDANTAFVATAPNSGTAGNGIWKTINGGTSWTQQTVYTTASFANTVYFWDANTGITTGDPVGTKFEIFRTTNGGTTWTAVAGAPLAAGGGFGLTGVKTTVGNDFWFGTTTGKIAHSTDKGLTWTIAFSPALDFGGGAAGGGVDGSSAKMAYRDTNNGILITVDGNTAGGTPIAAMYNTTDGGASWNPMTPTGPWYFGEISRVPGTANSYVTSGITNVDVTLTGTSYTKDGGLTWTGIDTGAQRGPLDFVSPTTGWCGIFSDGPAGVTGMLKFNGNLSLAVSDTSTKSALKVYPNPAVDVVNVTSNREIKAVTVIDLTGKVIKSVKTSGEINVSSLAKGTYILQVYYGGDTVENTKLIKK